MIPRRDRPKESPGRSVEGAGGAAASMIKGLRTHSRQYLKASCAPALFSKLGDERATRLAAAPEFTKAGVSVDLGQTCRPLRQIRVADTARCPRCPTAAIRQSYGSGMEAVRGGSRKRLREWNLRRGR